MEVFTADIIVPVEIFLTIAVFVRFYYAWPEYPPLETNPDDPLMQEASRQAVEN
jgi:hypothetical protein